MNATQITQNWYPGSEGDTSFCIANATIFASPILRFLDYLCSVAHSSLRQLIECRFEDGDHSLLLFCKGLFPERSEMNITKHHCPEVAEGNQVVECFGG